MPTDTPTFKKTLCDESQGLADKWAESVLEVAGLGVARSLSEGPLPDDHQAKFAGWSSPQKVGPVRSSPIILLVPVPVQSSFRVLGEAVCLCRPVLFANCALLHVLLLLLYYHEYHRY